MKNLTIPIQASFKNEANISNLEKINLFFGYNGSGKTSISRILGNNHNAVVYNEDFIEENFRNIDKQKGIFTIGKEAGDAKERIKEATILKDKFQTEINQIAGNKDLGIKGLIKENNETLEENWTSISEKLWNIKKDTDSTPLLNCIPGLRRDGAKLAASFIQYFSDKRRIEIKNLSDGKFWANLEQRSKIVFNDTLEKKETLKLPPIKKLESIIINSIWGKQIIGNKENNLYSLINELKNSDWVNQGRSFLNEKGLCPFCQEPLKKEFLEDLSSYFNETYEKDKDLLKQLSTEFTFSESIDRLKELQEEEFTKNSGLDIKIIEFEQLLNDNLELIEKKLNNPSSSINLNSLKSKYKELAIIVGAINHKIIDYNKRILKRGEEKTKLTKDFWDYYTSYYKDDIERYITKNEQLKSEIQKYNESVTSLKTSILSQNKIIAENQAKLTNIQTSINSINNSLVRNGFTSFKVKKWGDDSCRIIRTESNKTENIYMSLSEGEKTIISFLYFIELCKGTTDKEKEITNDKIIVIDDPISSLSHNIVFEVAQLIRSEFLNIKQQEKYNQLYILTHNLYLFYEIRGNISSIENKIIESTKSTNEETIKVFNTYRVKKDNNDNSIVIETSRDEILTDYDVYWSIVKDCRANCGYKAMLPNAMRNILEYYFGFIKDEQNLNNALENIVDRKFVRQRKLYF